MLIASILITIFLTVVAFKVGMKLIEFGFLMLVAILILRLLF